MIHKTYVALIALAASLALNLSAHDASVIETQKAIIQEEELQLVEIYGDAKKSAKESLLEHYSETKQLIKQAVDLILETPEFKTYTEYMTDFQASLIVKGGLVAEELPTVGPDKNLFSAINTIILQVIGQERMANPEVQELLGAYLTLRANRVGTEVLLAKLDQINQ